jgi:steroid delta-isomerase-like uncharacterized protein
VARRKLARPLNFQREAVRGQESGRSPSSNQRLGGLTLARSCGYRSGIAVSASISEVSPELQSFVERYLDAWNRCDTDAMAQLITEDIEWADPALPEPARGVAGVQEFMRASVRAFPDLRFGEPDPRVLAVTGDVVLWGWYMEGTNRGALDPPGFAPTGRTMRVEGVDQWTMRDGRIARYRAFYDMNDVARQLGIAPAPGSRGERGMVALQRLQVRLSRR